STPSGRGRAGRRWPRWGWPTSRRRRGWARPSCRWPPTRPPTSPSWRPPPATARRAAAPRRSTCGRRSTSSSPAPSAWAPSTRPASSTAGSTCEERPHAKAQRRKEDSKERERREQRRGEPTQAPPARSVTSFPGSAWERTSWRLCLPTAAPAEHFTLPAATRLRGRASRSCVPRQRLGTRKTKKEREENKDGGSQRRPLPPFLLLLSFLLCVLASWREALHLPHGGGVPTPVARNSSSSLMMIRGVTMIIRLSVSRP